MCRPGGAKEKVPVWSPNRFKSRARGFWHRPPVHVHWSRKQKLWSDLWQIQRGSGRPQIMASWPIGCRVGSKLQFGLAIGWGIQAEGIWSREIAVSRQVCQPEAASPPPNPFHHHAHFFTIKKSVLGEASSIATLRGLMRLASVINLKSFTFTHWLHFPWCSVDSLLVEDVSGLPRNL